MRHIASTDASVARAEAAAMVSGWFLTSKPERSRDSSASPASATHGSAGRAMKQTGTSTAAVLEVGGRSLTGEEQLLADDRYGLCWFPLRRLCCPMCSRDGKGRPQQLIPLDRCMIMSATSISSRCRAFLEWAEGSSGAARIAMELKALRSAAAARKVADLAGTAEGKEGLVRGLAEALKHDPSLRLQLGALLH